MAYDLANPAKPDPAVDNGTAAFDYSRKNLRALRDMAIAGVARESDGTWHYSHSGGTAAEPAERYWTKGTQRIRAQLTWTGGYITREVWAYSADYTAGSPVWDQFADTTYTYDGNGDVTATSGASGGSSFKAVLYTVLGRAKSTLASLTSHIGLVVANGVHGMGTIAGQNANAVAITGGTIAGTDVDAKRLRENFADYGAIANGGTVTLELDKYAHFAVTPHATTSSTMIIALSGAPAANKAQVWTLEIINGQRSADAKITWPAAFKWIGGNVMRPADTTLELAGRNLFVLQTRDGGGRFEVQHLGKGG